VGYLMQAGVGAMFVLSGADALWGAAHVGLAAATWALLVALSVIETLNTRSEIGYNKENEWQGQSEAISN
jgi:heme A synthase